MKKSILVLLTIFTLFGCTEKHDIKVNLDGSAEVEYNLIYDISKETNDSTNNKSESYKDSISKVFKKYYKNKFISNYNFELIDNQGIKVKYKISDINHLGDFLCPSMTLNHPVKIMYSKKEFVIDAGMGDSDPQEDIGGQTNSLKCDIKFTFPEKIKKINNESGVNIIKSENSIEIISNMGELNFSGKKNKVTLKF